MTTASHSLPPVAIVVRWPQRAVPAVAQLLHQCLVDGGMAATWAMESPVQAGMLAPLGTGAASAEAALLSAAPGRRGDPCEAIAASLKTFYAAGLKVQTVNFAGKLARDNVGRRLHQAGVRAVVAGTTRAAQSAVGALPFGVWRFVPHLTAPITRRWWQLFKRPRRDLFGPHAAIAVAMFDLGSIHSISGRPWREVEHLLAHICEAQDNGVARIATVAQIARELSAQAAPRPQRSILRAA
ncbi:MAG: hypothetical protein IT424_05565 [Pirellulales bacterium]|nr:hypothetical protein [Pirellulales bacterium]